MTAHTKMNRRTGYMAAMAAILVGFVMAIAAASAEAIPLPGTESERANTTTPLPPGGDQCSSSPDTISGLVDFSYSCYGHDLCWQNNSYNGVSESESSCNQIFLDNMREECDEQNTGFGSSIPEGACKTIAEDYYTVVSGISAVSDVGAPGEGSDSSGGGGGGTW